MIYLDGRCSAFPLEKHCHALSDVLFREEGGGRGGFAAPVHVWPVRFVTHLGTSHHRDRACKNVGGRHLKALSKQIRTNEPPLTWAVCVMVGHGDPGPGVLIIDFQKQGPLTGRPTSHLPRECKSNHSVNSPILDNQFCGPVFCNVVCRDHHGP